MSTSSEPLWPRLWSSVKGHFKTFCIAVIFGLSVYLLLMIFDALVRLVRGS